MQALATQSNSKIISTDAGEIIKQWLCVTVFSKLKPTKDLQSFFRSCALSTVFMGITQGNLMKKDCRWHIWSSCTQNYDADQGLYREWRYRLEASPSATCRNAFLAFVTVRDCIFSTERDGIVLLIVIGVHFIIVYFNWITQTNYISWNWSPSIWIATPSTPWPFLEMAVWLLSRYWNGI